MKRGLIYILLAALANAPAAAQQNQPAQKNNEQPSPMQKLNEFSRVISERINLFGNSGNALTRMEEARSLARDYPPEAKPQEYALLTNFLKQYSADLGNYLDALRYDDFNRQKYPDDLSANSALAGYHPVSAIKAISQAAADRQVVIINEAHHVPQHRVFTLELLKSLKRRGFKYFAAEALFNSEAGLNRTDTELNRRGYPTKNTGSYMDEPVYGDLIRTALRLGYKVVPYDAGFNKNGQLNTPAAREREAAENLKERIFKGDPRAKVLIHVGYDHNSEAARVYGGSQAMAGYLKELTGIDPLTVDQTAMTEHSAPEYEDPLYRFVAARNAFDKPLVFQNARGEFWKKKAGGQDINVFSPRSRYANNRPTWLRMNGARRPYLLPADICQAETHCLVRARIAGESANAVPVDQLEVRGGTGAALMLPKGAFIIEVENVAGKSLKTWRVER